MPPTAGDCQGPRLPGSDTSPLSSLNFAGMHAQACLGTTCVSALGDRAVRCMRSPGSSSCMPVAVPEQRATPTRCSEAPGTAASAAGSSCAGPEGVASATLARQDSWRSATTGSACRDVLGAPAAGGAAAPVGLVESAGEAAGASGVQQLRMERDARRRECRAQRAAEEAGAAEAVRLFRAAWGC